MWFIFWIKRLEKVIQGLLLNWRALYSVPFGNLLPLAKVEKVKYPPTTQFSSINRISVSQIISSTKKELVFISIILINEIRPNKIHALAPMSKKFLKNHYIYSSESVNQFGTHYLINLILLLFIISFTKKSYFLI